MLPTSYLNVYQDPHFSSLTSDKESTEYSRAPPVASSTLRGIQGAARRLLELSLKHGQTYIITNALDGWVQLTARRFLPELVPLLDKVCIISARGKYEDERPADPDLWKEMAFLEICRDLDEEKAANLISLGDSNHEIKAAWALGRALGWLPEAERRSRSASPPSSPRSSATTASDDSHSGAVAAPESLVKTVKFQERPSAEELRKQLEAVAAKFEQIVLGPKDLQICLAKRFVGPSAP
mmetsp:Transcript_14900/g.42962  ORF Transcript_14900/g.42962 Transcript_14900/m.42962 type:complete len:239 (+) Transcript_14900:105-821(+)